MINDTLAVNAVGNGFANQLIIERSDGVIKTDEKYVQRRAVKQRQVAVRFNRIKIFGSRVVNAVRSARLKFQQTLSSLIRPAENYGLNRRSLSPIIGIGFKDDAVAVRPFFYGIGAGAIDRVTHFD